MGKEFASGSGIACQVGSEKSGSYQGLLLVSASTGHTAPVGVEAIYEAEICA